MRRILSLERPDWWTCPKCKNQNLGGTYCYFCEADTR